MIVCANLPIHRALLRAGCLDTSHAAQDFFVEPVAPHLRCLVRSNPSWLTELLLSRIVCEGLHAVGQGPCGFAHDRVGRDRGRIYGMTRFCNPCLCLWRIVIGLRTIDWNLVYPDRQ